MALPSRGAISFSDINAELGRSRTAQINLGDVSVRSLVGTPAGAGAGTIGLSAGYGKASGGISSFSYTTSITVNTPNYNLKTAAIAAGWDQISILNATVTIAAGVYVYSVSTGSYAFDTGANFTTGTTLALINNGTILGMGGVGGGNARYDAPGYTLVNATAGAAGGPALNAQYAIAITNNGSIAGGGGGGGGGGAMAG